MRSAGTFAVAAAVAVVAAVAPAWAAGTDAGAGAQAAASDGGPAAAATASVPAKSAPAVSVQLSARRVELGKPFHAVVSVRHAPGVQVNLPASLHLGDTFSEIGRTHTSAHNADGTTTDTFDLSLMAFDTGDLELPPIEVTYAVRGNARKVTSKKVPIHVVGVVGSGQAKLRDVAAPVTVMRRDLTPLYVLGGVLAAILLLVALWYVRRRLRARRRREVEASAALRRPPDEEALARLDALEASGALDAADRKPAYIELSEIIREYIGRRYGFPALELTTLEIRDYAGGRPDMEELCELIDGWLEECDLVKYADYDASADEARRSFYRGRLVVERTRIRAVAAGVSADAATTPSVDAAPPAPPTPPVDAAATAPAGGAATAPPPDTAASSPAREDDRA